MWRMVRKRGRKVKGGRKNESERRRRECERKRRDDRKKDGSSGVGMWRKVRRWSERRKCEWWSSAVWKEGGKRCKCGVNDD